MCKQSRLDVSLVSITYGFALHNNDNTSTAICTMRGTAVETRVFWVEAFPTSAPETIRLESSAGKRINRVHKSAALPTVAFDAKEA